MSSAELHMRSRLLLRVLCAAATIACLPLLLWSSGERGVAAAATPHHNKLRRRGLRQQKRQRWRRQWPHLALVDVDDFASLLGDDFDWAATSIPFLDLDTSVPGADALLRAYYFRWRVFSRHLRSTAGASADPHSSTQGGDLQCCSADASACSLVSAATGWCAGAKTEGECHGRRTESKPCVWSRASGRCAKGFPYGTSSSPSCPEPLAPSAAAAVITVPPPWVVTEFEADVPWAGAYNTISCAAGHHLMEGRWLRNRSYLDSYARFWLTSPAGASNARKYTFWVASAVYERSLVTGDASLLLELYPALQANYRAWVGSQLSHTHRCLWQYADRDGQENSIGGDGCRPLLQSVMYGEAMALAAIAELAGDASGAHRFRDEARRWQRALLSLWAPARAFFMTRAVARPASAPRHDWAEQQRRSSRALNQGRCPPEWREGELVSSRELQGLSSPWYFGAVPAEEAAQYAASWAPLFDPTSGFAAPWGPRTAERSDPCYNYSTAHESDWQAPSWPFETSKVITGALRFLHEYPPTAHRTRGAIDARQLWALLTQYAGATLHAHSCLDPALMVALAAPPPPPTTLD